MVDGLARPNSQTRVLPIGKFYDVLGDPSYTCVRGKRLSTGRRESKSSETASWSTLSKEVRHGGVLGHPVPSVSAAHFEARCGETYLHETPTLPSKSTRDPEQTETVVYRL